ncbi:MAG: DNA-binding protein [Chloroflexi bacterium HGW-Chloroflexi-10]|nr:MAG: DNA-binding protein [Chloroflexi bacterium HGW-Chloroflexi-10]
MKITVFGASSPKPDSPAYQFAYQLGEKLALAGFSVITGGYMGTMEAVSRGAAEKGGHVIGVTCNEIEKWRKTTANPWVQEEWRRNTLQDRLTTLIESCDAAIALPGGPGTLAEIVLMWNKIQIQAIPVMPIILIGTGWKKVMETLFAEQGEYIAETYKKWILFAETIDETFALLPLLKNNIENQ